MLMRRVMARCALVKPGRASVERAGSAFAEMGDLRCVMLVAEFRLTGRNANELHGRLAIIAGCRLPFTIRAMRVAIGRFGSTVQSWRW